MATLTPTIAGYQATRSGDELIIHRVPIFCTCVRGDLTFNEAWVAAAIARARLSEAEGYFPPLHIRHHEHGTETRAAGYFRIEGSEPITLKGKTRIAIMAELVVTDPMAQADILAKRLLYRSVEILDPDIPSIDSLALLDHEVPYLELPLLMVSDLDERSGGYRSFQVVCESAGERVAYFRRGSPAHTSFREDNMTATATKKKPATDFGAGVKFEQHDGDDGPPPKKKEGDGDGKDEDMEADGGADVKAICKAIESGEISVADMAAIMAAIQAQQSEGQTEDQTPAPAAVPGAESMRAKTNDDMTVKMAALQGQNEALKARLDARDAEEVRKDDVNAAMKRLEGRPLGADLRGRLMSFHKEHGAKAFGPYVEAMAQAVGVVGDDDSAAEAFRGHAGKVPEVAMKYQDQGTDAVDRAARFAKDWQELQGTGLTVTQERYVAGCMARFAAKVN